MKVSISWLKELVDLNIPVDQLIELIPLRIQGGIKEVGNDYFELDLKGYNRADLLSMRGVAQEVAAITDSKVKFSESPITPITPSRCNREAEVKVTDQNLVPLYCLAKIEGLKVGKSDPVWVKKLADCGMRSINNIADVTNLVMLEYGQPLHAFDAKQVHDESIIVRNARSGEKLTTLDGKMRELVSTDLLITDPKKILGIAGVMGGKESEVSNSTTAILLEAAIFDPISIRKTAQAHHLPSEASKRFQHGLTKTRLLQALNAAIKMYESLGGKLTALTIVGDTKDPAKTLRLSLEKTNNLIGIKIGPGELQEYLTRLGFISNLRGLIFDVKVPYWRLDIEIEEDLIEEVARLYGYEKIPPQKLRGKMPAKIDQSLFNLITDLKQKLVDLGLTEVQTYSFYSSKVTDNLKLVTDNLVKVANPMSKETEYLRDNLWPNLVEVADKNLRQGFGDIAVFEIGKVYSQIKDNLPEEEYRLSIALVNGSDNPIAEAYQIAQKLGLTKGDTTPDEYAKDYFHPTRFAHLLKGDGVVGGIAEVHPRSLDNFGINKRVAILELDLKESVP